ncbi:sulfotransferase [Planctomycetota bacterium]
MRKPNFFIVGAPKCGTTALNDYLGEHPSVFMFRPKEPHYFAFDVSQRLVPSRSAYLKGFTRNRSSTYGAVGEASVWYLWSQVAIPEIRRFDPEAKLIAVIRNPVDLVYSLHSELLCLLQEDRYDFEEAWRLQQDRRSGLRIPRRCANPQFLQYGEVARLGSQLERALSTFPRKQVKIVLFDDFVSEAQGTFEDVLAFLEVPPDGREDFPRINANRRLRFRWVQGLLPRLPQIRRWLGRPLGIHRLVTRLNVRRRRRPPLRLEFRRELVDVFRGEVDKLSALMGRDLRTWRTVT